MSHTHYWILLYGITLLYAGGCYLYLQQALMEHTYRLHTTQKQLHGVQQEIRRLQEQLNSLKQPDALRPLARQWGLVTPTPPQYLMLTDDMLAQNNS
jgi:hypothetical protein